MSDILIQLKKLKNDPRAGAVSSVEHEAAKERLLLAIGKEVEVAGETAPSFSTWFMGNFISKPIAASAAALVLAAGSLTTVNAAVDSLPGDKLYSVKRITEQAQLKLATLDKKAVLHTEFAERRLNEATKLREDGEENPARLALAKEAMVEYKKELTQASEDLKQLKNVVETPQTLAAVSDVKEKIETMETVIDKNVAANVSAEESEEALSAKEATQQIEDVATTVVVEVHEEEATEATTQELDGMFKKDLGAIEARQTFNEHRVEVLEKVFAEKSDIFTEEERVTDDEFKQLSYAVRQTRIHIPEAMNSFVAGGYRNAFESLKKMDGELSRLESKIAELEIRVTVAVEREESVPVGSEQPGTVDEGEAEDGGEVVPSESPVTEMLP